MEKMTKDGLVVGLIIEEEKPKKAKAEKAEPKAEEEKPKAKPKKETIEE